MRHLIRLVLVVMPLFLFASGCNKSREEPKKAVNLRLEAIRNAGFPVTLEELHGWYAEPAAGQNGATLYTEALGALSTAETTSPTFLAENQKALGLLHQAASGQKCRYPIDLTQGFETKLPHLAKVKSGARLLSAQANSHARKGEMELAAQCLLDGLSLARSLSEEPVLISHAVLHACEAIVQIGLESVLNQKKFTEEQLQRMQAAFGEAESGISSTRSIAGDRANVIALFQRIGPEQLKALSLAGGISLTENEWQAYRKSGAYQADFDFYLDRLEEAITSAALPFPKALEGKSRWSAQVAEAKSKGYVLSSALSGDHFSAISRDALGVGRLRLARVALALERYRLSHQNALPDSLSQLVPQSIDALPVDPFDGQPLRYTKGLAKGYTLYSVGTDGKDDSGKTKPTGTEDESGFDLTFVVRR